MANGSPKNNMMDQFAVGVYVSGDSLLHRLRARTKLLALLWLAGFIVVANQRAFEPAPYVALGGLACAAAALSGLGMAYLWRRMWLPALLILVGAVPVALLAGGDKPALYTLGPLAITAESVSLAVRLLIVLLALYLLALLLTATTSPVALIEGLTLLLGPLRRLRLPVDELALMALLALRFMPTLGAEVETLVKAQLARGADFMHGGLRDRADSLGALIVPVFGAVWRRAAALALALEARGLAAPGASTILHESALAWTDYLSLVLVVLATMAALLVAGF
jgi:energy-coupling factor transporter transmembrane protein EcfT